MINNMEYSSSAKLWVSFKLTTNEVNVIVEKDTTGTIDYFVLNETLAKVIEIYFKKE